MASLPNSFLLLFLTLLVSPAFLLVLCGRKKNTSRQKAVTPSEASRTSRRGISSRSEVPSSDKTSLMKSAIELQPPAAVAAPAAPMIPLSPPPAPAAAAAAPSPNMIASPKSDSGKRPEISKIKDASIKDQSNNFGKPTGAALSPVASDPMDSSYVVPLRRQMVETPKAVTDTDLFHTFTDIDEPSEKKLEQCKTPREEPTQSCSFLTQQSKTDKTDA